MIELAGFGRSPCIDPAVTGLSEPEPEPNQGQLEQQLGLEVVGPLVLKFWCIIGIMATAALVLLVAMVALLPACAGHGAIVYPPSRNAIDHSIEPWKSFTAFKGQFCSGKYDGPCWCPATDASGKLSGASGQACWWFSNGCSIPSGTIKPEARSTWQMSGR